MQSWIRVTLILCAFGTLRELRPSEPFVSEFLSGPWRNVTEDQLNRDVYPIGTYSYLAQLVVVFLVTDFLRFKPIIILSALSGIAVYAVLLWTRSLEWLQVSQFLYGMYMATEVAYLTYIYAQVNSSKYPRVSSYTRVAALAGRFISGVSSQLLVHFDVMDYRDLNYITLVAQILATFWAFWLPPVLHGIYFHRRISASGKEVPLQSKSLRSNVTSAVALIASHMRTAYTRGRVLAWSALYAVALAYYVQLQSNMQLLWRLKQADVDSPVVYNGYAEAATTLLGACGALTSQRASNTVLPAIATLIQGISLFITTHIENMFVSYAGYIVVGTLFHYTITLASAKIACELADESCFGLIFGINTLIGTLVQTIIILILIQSLSLSIYSQFYSISFLYLLLAVMWLAGWSIYKCRQKKGIVNTSNQY